VDDNVRPAGCLSRRYEIDVARADRFSDDLANRSRVIREAAGLGKPPMEIASA
jgi:hypothetical protein